MKKTLRQINDEAEEQIRSLGKKTLAVIVALAISIVLFYLTI